MKYNYQMMSVTNLTDENEDLYKQKTVKANTKQ